MRRSLTILLGLGIGLGLILGKAQAQELHQVASGMGDRSVSPISVTKALPAYMGWYKQEGLDVNLVPAGSSAAVLAGMASGRFAFGTALATFQLPLLAKGEDLPAIDFFETIYPFKYQIGVNPGSPIHSMADLKGKRIGVSNFGVSGKLVGAELLRRAGLDPDKDVSWLAVGEGVQAGLAMKRDAIDALIYYNTGFGEIEASGIPTRYLELPKPVPMIGGSFISASPTFLREHRDWAVGFGRAVAKAQIFTAANPEAAAYIFVKMYPEAAPKNMSLRDQVKAVMVPLVKLAPLLINSPKPDMLGYMRPEEWREEVKFNKVEDKVTNLDKVFTNDLIADINKFDHEKIRQQALNFKIDYGS